MQALRLLPPEFLLPAWSFGQLTQFRWLHDLSGQLVRRKEGSVGGGKDSSNPLFRKQYSIDRSSAQGLYRTRSTAATKSTQHHETAGLDAQIEVHLLQKHIACAPAKSNAKTRFGRHTGQHNGEEATSEDFPSKQQVNDGSRARTSPYHLHAENTSSPPMSRATNTNKRSQTGGLRGQPSVAHVQYQRQSLRTGPLSEQEHKVDESSDISRGHKKDERENTYKPWGWMSLPSFSEMSEDGHKRQQYPSIELPSQPKLASDCKPEPRPKPTSGFGPKFQRSDIKLLSATSEEPELEEAENDRVTLPATQPTRHGIPGNREHKLLSSSGMIQGGSIKSRKDVGYNQRSPLGRTRLRDKSNFRVPPAAEEMIHKPAQRELSLLEQLFPEEAKTQSKASEHEQNPQEELARLPPPEFDKHHEALSDDSSYTQFSSKLKTREATVSAFRQENTTILLLSRVSTALCDEDFRRIVPRGVHIEEWRGPGDILKVIPSRDISSLSPTSNYYLLFSNPAYARAYQNQAIHLHQLAQTYTPTSLDFPMPPPPGILDSKGQDVYALLQDFTISPPSVRMSLRVLLPPYHANLQRLLENEGYPQLVQSGSKTGSSVLFWVDGHQPSALSVRTMLSKDGLDRGLQWGPLRGHGGIKVLHVHANHDGGEIGENDFTGPGDEYGHSEWKDTELKPKRHGHQRWIIYFEDEAEARRFVRVWHRRPYPFPLQEESPSYGEPQPLVHAEYMW